MHSGPPPYSLSSHPSNRSSEQSHLRPEGHNQNGYGAANDNRSAKREDRKLRVSLWFTTLIILTFLVALFAFITQLMRSRWYREMDSLNYEKRKIMGREEEVQRKTEYLSTLDRQLKSREARIADEKREIAEREEKVQYETERLSSLDHQLKSREAGIAEEKRKIAGREEKVQRKAERLSTLDRQLKSREAGIAEEKRKIAGREEKMQRKTERLSTLDRQLKYKEARIIDEQEKINDQKKDSQRERERLGLDAERIARSNVHWGPLKWDEACVSWKKMRYSAELENLPHDVDGMAWCHAMSTDIFGTTFKMPDYCDKTLLGRIIGHWTRTDEPYCNTYWGNKQDHGCQPGVPGYRRIRMQLLDLHQPWKETWLALCQTTPWPGHGTPENCENAGRDGIWGEWRLRDDECQEQ